MSSRQMVEGEDHGESTSVVVPSANDVDNASESDDGRDITGLEDPGLIANSDAEVDVDEDDAENYADTDDDDDDAAAADDVDDGELGVSAASVASADIMRSKIEAYRLQVDDLDKQLLKAKSEASINAELESRARHRQLELEKALTDCQAQLVSLKAAGAGAGSTAEETKEKGPSGSPTKTSRGKNLGPAFGATAELVVRLRAENTSLREELMRSNEAARVATEAAKQARGGGKAKGAGDVDALEYAMQRDSQLKELSNKNFELFHRVEQGLEEIAASEARVEGAKRDIRKKRARIRDLHGMLKKERSRRVAAETESEKLKDKVKGLTKHIEKLMSALRVQAQEKNRRDEEAARTGRKVNKMKRKINLTRNKGYLSERVIVQLRQQVEMLTGQLRLADDRFTELRSTLDMERRTNQALQKKSKRAFKQLHRQEEMAADHISRQKIEMEKQRAELLRKTAVEQKRLKRARKKLDAERTEMMIMQEAGRRLHNDAMPASDELDVVDSNEGLTMTFSPTKVDLYERVVSTPPMAGSGNRGSLHFHSLPELPSPAQQSSPMPSAGLAAQAKAEKIAQRKEELRQQRMKNREHERIQNELHFWRTNQDSDDGEDV